MRATAWVAVPLALALSGVAQAQKDIGGKDTFPQFRVLSGLPGGGYGVLPEGRPSILGAAALTTPIGYTQSGHIALGFFNTGNTNDPFRFDGSGSQEEKGNGTAYAVLGGSYGGWNGSVSGVILSRNLDSVLNFQVSPPIKGRLGVSFGVQDIDGGGGSAGTGFPTDRDSSRSLYGAATYHFGHTIYATLGTGTRRFKNVFGNASAPIFERLRAVVEYDTFNFNAGLIYNPGRFRNLRGKAGEVEANLFLGVVAGKYGTLGLSFTL